MEQASANTTNSEDSSVSVQAPWAVVMLRSGDDRGPMNGATAPPTPIRAATIRVQRGPRPETA